MKELFYITAELDAPVETLRHQIEQELAVEGLYNIGIFKVSKVLPTLNEKLTSLPQRFPYRGQPIIKPRRIPSDMHCRPT